MTSRRSRLCLVYSAGQLGPALLVKRSGFFEPDQGFAGRCSSLTVSSGRSSIRFLEARRQRPYRKPDLGGVDRHCDDVEAEVRGERMQIRLRKALLASRLSEHLAHGDSGVPGFVVLRLPPTIGIAFNFPKALS
jgi:hypothetical protein